MSWIHLKWIPAFLHILCWQCCHCQLVLFLTCSIVQTDTYYYIVDCEICVWCIERISNACFLICAKCRDTNHFRPLIKEVDFQAQHFIFPPPNFWISLTYFRETGYELFNCRSDFPGMKDGFIKLICSRYAMCVVNSCRIIRQLHTERDVFRNLEHDTGYVPAKSLQWFEVSMTVIEDSIFWSRAAHKMLKHLLCTNYSELVNAVVLGNEWVFMSCVYLKCCNDCILLCSSVLQ